MRSDPRRSPKKTDQAKNRIHSVVLDEEAERLFREVSKQKGHKSWIHSFLSQKIKETYGYNKEEKILIDKLYKAQQERDKKESEINEIAEKLKQIREGK